MVARRSHAAIYKMMVEMHEAKNLAEEVNWDIDEDILVKITTYSDSIMVYSKEDSMASLTSLISAVSMLTNELFNKGIPHKGAVAFGNMTLDSERSIFFGQPLIDAYLLQEELQFYGVIIHATAEQRLLRYFKGQIEEFPHIVNYLCPLKNGVTKHLTISPFQASFNEGTQDDSINIEMFNGSLEKLRFKTSGYLRKYIDNTELYIESLKKTKA